MMSRWQEIKAGSATPPPLAEIAVEFSRCLDVPVFACDADKRPLYGLKWQEKASREAVDIRAMFARPGAAMIGMPTGPTSGYSIIDIDVKDGRAGDTWLSNNASRIASTRTSSTRSGGVHLWYRHVSGIRNSASRIAPGVDVRGEGGYVIVPPSPGYTWAKDIEAVDMPQWLVDAAIKPEPEPPQPRAYRPAPVYHDGGSAYGLRGLEDECDAIRTAADGAKHATINKAAYSVGGLVAGGELEQGVAWAALCDALDVILPFCKDQHAARKTLDRAFREGLGKPRDVAPLPERAPIVGDIVDGVDMSGLMAKIRAKRSAAVPEPVADDLLAVGGVIGMLVEECSRTAIRRQPFLALGAAICAVGALAGRRYRGPTDLRTNIYIAAIAESGAGKDHAPEVIRRCMSDSGLDRYLGGENLASGRAVLSSLEQHPARLFQLDELGLFLRTVTSKNAPGHKAEIWSELMKLYSRAKGTYGGTEYADQKANARVNLQQPHACLYGMTTPSTFWSALEGGAMLDGSLARFLLFVTDDHRPARNKFAGIIEPPERLLQALREIAAGVDGHDYGGNLGAAMLAGAPMTPFTVPMSREADSLHDEMLEREEDAWALRVAGTPAAAIVNRLGENSAKLALVRAISNTPQSPRIERADVAWAWALALHCTRALLQDADRHMADSDFERKLNKTLEIIRKHGPCTEYQMVRKGFKLPERDRREVLATLVAGGMVACEESGGGPGKGPPTRRYSVA